MTMKKSCIGSDMGYQKYFWLLSGCRATNEAKVTLVNYWQSWTVTLWCLRSRTSAKSISFLTTNL